MSVSLLGRIGLRQEKEFGETPSPPVAFGEILSESFSMNNNFILSKSMTGLRCDRDALPGKITASGGFDVYAAPEELLGWLLKGLLGAVSSGETEPGVFEHVFSVLHKSQLPGFSLQVYQEAACATWLGCAISGATLDVAPNGILKLGVDVAAQRPVASQPAAPVFSGIAPWVASNVSFTLNGGPALDFESFSLRINNNLNTVHTMSGKRYCSKHCARSIDVSGGITLAFEDAEQMRRLWGAQDAAEPGRNFQAGSLSINILHPAEIAPGLNYSLCVNLPQIFYDTASANISSPDSRIIQRINFTASYHSGQKKIVEFILRNGESGYPDPE